MMRTTSKVEEDKELAPKHTLQRDYQRLASFRATICATTLIAGGFMIQLKSGFAWNAFMTHVSYFLSWTLYKIPALVLNSAVL